VEPLVDVIVEDDSQGLFRLTVRHRNFDVTETFDNLSMDPNSADYVVTRVHERWPSFNSVTVKDLHDGAGARSAPAPGSFSMHSLPGIFGVHTGQIVHPIAWFARTVRESGRLRTDPVLAAKADEFTDAAIAAVAVHDDRVPRQQHAPLAVEDVAVADHERAGGRARAQQRLRQFRQWLAAPPLEGQPPSRPFPWSVSG
jgi:hypothetical protein